jgi:hypothetical protein
MLQLQNKEIVVVVEKVTTQQVITLQPMQPASNVHRIYMAHLLLATSELAASSTIKL